jgi:protein-L-isoaspartate(D-aspartate) O-methyltransferase
MNPYKQKVAAFYNSRRNYDNDDTRDRALRHFDFVSLQPGHSVLDVATGTGNISIRAAEIVLSNGCVIGIDIATDLLEIARQKIQDKALTNVQLIEIDAEEFTATDQQFDAIFCSYAIVLFADIPAILEKWYRWLKPGGFITFTSFGEDTFLTPIKVEACDRYGVTLPNLHFPLGTPDRCEHLLRQTGFHRVEVHPEQRGSYLTLDQAKNRWDARFWLHPDDPLRSLDAETVRQIKAAYDAALDSLATDQGVWDEDMTFYVIAYKPN